ncbi:MAG: recombinase family protein [Bradyrhizobium sp.]|uniref:recombinase family protein n=1 Tax=Bradyrhizobium sp. TaxID=376 RepID=UPI0025BBE961|nr:recombinase family protein [Bradyrhizobium sp.]MBI5263854.1 recombinase family protein [Bradyrhizobium sp.]
MANALVIRKGTSLAKRIKALRAAQYVRMSTDHQRYSIQNQAAAIAAYAQQNGLNIVQTYRDDGRSGLRINGRPGLAELINDVRSGKAEFDNILVYDVSRWGRFQDVDESAYYEFICKENGIKVTYCAEQFDNDGSLLSSIVKNIKRVMAAEFSRELSVKVHTGHCRVASLGFRVGGPLTFGLRRELIGESRQSKGQLEKGERKSLQTDRVQLALGPQEETAIVKWIFRQFVVEQSFESEIARKLNDGGAANQHGRPWTDTMVHNILRNENYAGNIVYNRTSRRLGQKLVNNPRDRWVRSDPVLDPVIDPELFARAQEILAERYISIPEEDMLRRLRLLLRRKGKLTARMICAASGLPSTSSYIKHFGSLRKAFQLIGYGGSRNYDWIDSKEHWLEVLEAHARQVAEAIGCSKVEINTRFPCVTVRGRVRIHFQVARHLKMRGSNHVSSWRIHRRQNQSGLLVVLRLDEANKAIADYLILPAAKLSRRYLCFSEGHDRGAVRVKRAVDLVTATQNSLALFRR